MRFDYATILPWMYKTVDGDGVKTLLAVAGPDAVALRGGELPDADDHRHASEFDIREGEVVNLSLVWFRSYRAIPPLMDADKELASTYQVWADWADWADCHGRYASTVRRSLLVLRALSDTETGGIVAAATTSLPEDFGGSRNWDYRYCWLRDAALTLEALMLHGYSWPAQDWRSWLLRAIAGDPQDLQIMYGIAGERDLAERELESLPGYQGSSPVRVGNGAVGQYQADVLGEVLVALETARKMGVEEDQFSWPLQRGLLISLEDNWDLTDNGIWEIRGPQRTFTHSQVMTWAAFDRGVKAVRDHGLDGPADRWAALRDKIRDRIEEQGFDAERGSYVQYYGGKGVDASLLVLSQVGYCEPNDERMLGTVAVLEAELMRDGLLLRYRTETNVDGLPGGEHPFLACSFWLVEQYARSGRLDDARTLMDRLVGFSNDVGLLSEEYDVGSNRQVGNTPQAFSHLALVRAADAINAAEGGPKGSLIRG